MRRYIGKVYDQFVAGSGTTTVTTGGDFDDILGLCDQLALEVTCDRVSGTSPQIQVTLQGSNDRRNWISKSTAIISTTSLTAGQTNVLEGSDAGSVPNLGYIRLEIVLTGTNPATHVRVYATGRSKGRKSEAVRRPRTKKAGKAGCVGCDGGAKVSTPAAALANLLRLAAAAAGR